MSMERVTELVDELALEVMFRLRGDEGAAELDEERLKADRAKIEEFRSELQAFIARRNSSLRRAIRGAGIEFIDEAGDAVGIRLASKAHGGNRIKSATGGANATQ